MDAGDDTTQGRGGPIFLVGPSRSGTTLLRAILNGLPDVWLSDETHYFDDLRPRLAMASGNASRARILGECQRFFEQIETTRYEDTDADAGPAGVMGPIGMGPNNALAASDAMFAARCRAVARAHGASTWGEKTPRHVFRIDDILAAFPTAKVVCMMRDSRAVVGSYRDWPLALSREAATDEAGTAHLDRSDELARRARSYNILLSGLMWRAAVNAACRARVTHGAGTVRFVRYEDLVHKPEETIRDLANWLGLTFDKRCLEIPMQNSSAHSYKSNGGIVTDAADRWRKSLSATEIGLIEWVTGAQMQEMGYTPSGGPVGTLPKLRALLSLPFGIGRAAVANRHRMGGIFPFIARRLRSI